MPAAPSILQILKLADFEQDLEKARQETNTDPTPAQIEAENYRKGVVKVRGLTIAIENPKGSVRSGTSKSGKKWSQTMAWDYGYAKKVDAVDGDKLDIFIGPDPEKGKIFVVDQVLAGKYDESKVMLGFPDEASACEGYLANYEKGWKGLGSITEMSDSKFSTWITGGQTSPADKSISKAAFLNASMKLASDPVSRILQREGGTQKITHDSGGWTRGGIAESRGTHTANQIKQLTPAQIKQIWQQDWNASGAKFPDQGAGEVFFDIKGNAGLPRATGWLQEALNKQLPKGYPRVPVNNRFGPQTQQALTQVDQAALARQLFRRFEGHHQRLVQQKPEVYGKYSKGWANRRSELQRVPAVSRLLQPGARVAPVVRQPNGAVKVKGIAPPGARIISNKPQLVRPKIPPPMAQMKQSSLLGLLLKRAIVEQQEDGTWVLWNKEKTKKLGTHASARKAYAQEYAIQKSQERKAPVEKQAMSREDLVSRGSCCGNKCRNCPYEPRHQKGATAVKVPEVVKPAVDDVLKNMGV